MKKKFKLVLTIIMIFLGIKNLNAQSIKEFYKKLNLEKTTHCGALIYNAENNDTIFKHNIHQYFVPASTIKMFTYYSALHNLPDTLNAFKYEIVNDSIFVWGVGNPSLLNPLLKIFDEKAFEILKNTDKKIVLCWNRYQGNPYGKGWMWDDYEDTYQPEINEFPLYGNLIAIEIDNNKANTCPKIIDFSYEWGNKFKKNYHKNHFEIPKNKNKKWSTTYITNAENNALILENYLHKKIYIHYEKPMSEKTLIQKSSIPRDSLLTWMMQESDNFFAEQIHLMICDAQNLEMNTSKSIDYLKKNTFNFVNDDFEWVDGSGLSKYNLIKPSQIVSVLNKLKTIQDSTQQIYPMLAIGGQKGTLKKLFTLQLRPYVFGKTGTLTGVACIAGFIETKSGKNLTFAVMTNNHVVKAKEIRSEIEKLINFVYQNY